MRWLVYALVFLLTNTAICQDNRTATAQQTRFFKAECGTAADYLELRKDGTYRVIAREHVGPIPTERGKWQQNGSVITFTPASWLRGGKTVDAKQQSYEGTEEHYRGRTFLTFKTEHSAGIVIPSDDIKRDLDNDNNALPEYVFFKTTRKVFASETKEPYPFRYIKPQ